MVNVSKQALKDAAQRIILNDILSLMSGSNDKRSPLYMRAWLELASETERMQLAKRLALILLLARDVSYGAIEKTLKVSSATVAHHDMLRRNGAYRSIEQLTASPVRRRDIVRLLDSLMTLGLPRYCERNRWKWLDGQDLKR